MSELIIAISDVSTAELANLSAALVSSLKTVTDYDEDDNEDADKDDNEDDGFYYIYL